MGTDPGTRVLVLGPGRESCYGQGVYLGDFPRPGWNHPATIALCEDVISRHDTQPPIIDPVVYYGQQVADGHMTREQADQKIAVGWALDRAERARPLSERAWCLALRTGRNPMIRMDDGRIVWGCMSWWTPVERIPAAERERINRLPQMAAPLAPPLPSPADLTRMTVHPALAHLEVESAPGAAALFSPYRSYRYALTRTWSTGPPAVFIMLNPSTADAVSDDATIRRCIRFAQREGCGGLVVVNAYALRATDPRQLESSSDPAGPDNAKVLLSDFAAAAAADGPLIAAWGANTHLQRTGHLATVSKLVDAAGMQLSCLGSTRHGHPRHPVRLPADTRLMPYTFPLEVM